MTKEWEPQKYHNRSREILTDWIKSKIQHKGTISANLIEKKPKKPRHQFYGFA